ncbi:hypothetical protein B0A81_09630 [Flavobacterium plurextorum]|uniref:Uncharacterized protein n=1 Tax=Flavobacterium plurextorum TaxID=1114867 RepID=A0ABX4CWJ1_9FLAO|nr:hypothetical protein [Flavobacterium plurextorum]OXB08560.1 hypothetical protein B0A81_09630 [Flavobacterium plurextorum]
MKVEKFNKFIIKKKLRMALLKVLEVKYHLSYDTIEGSEDFTNHTEARNYILCVLKKTGFSSIDSFNNSSFIITYSDRYKNPDELFAILNENLKSKFHYSISLIGKSTNSRHFVSHNPRKHLNSNLQDILSKLSCDNYQ